MASARFEIEFDQIGYGSVFVNGEDLSDLVTALRIDAGHSEATQLSLQMRGTGRIKGEGIVYVSGGVDLERLKKLDPGEIERRALDRLGWDGTAEAKTVTEHTVDVIAEMLGG